MNELDSVLIIYKGKIGFLARGLLVKGDRYFKQVPYVRNCPGDRKFLVRIGDEGFLVDKEEALMFDDSPALVYREYIR